MMIEVYDINIPELDMYVSENENQLRHYMSQSREGL